MAFKLMMRGGLWNTMTMVFKLDTLLELVRRVHPAVYLNFCRFLEAIGTTEEQPTIEGVYEKLEPVNFSKEIMERIAVRYPESVSVLPVREVFWSDLGSRERVLQVLRKLTQHKAGKIQAVPYSIKGCQAATENYGRRPIYSILRATAPRLESKDNQTSLRAAILKRL